MLDYTILADWEIGLARLTTSAVFCDCFLLRTKIPSAKVLTQCVMPHALNRLKTVAKEECRGANATLQCDGWTGENHHHLLGFMMTAQRKLHTVKVYNASRDPQTAEELLQQILEAISKIETEWGATVIACTTDASEKFPHLVVPDCIAHQV
ncbi:hypothetical protein EDB19DRAFT_1893254 [Suillus lakei]|nr:hypothetical protein EDB19DRAFT_1893254 [Suillus lakei]